jgi:predicted transcriptional regulator
MKTYSELIEFVKDRITLLATLNVFQPLNLVELKNALEEQMKGRDIEAILASLMTSGYVIKQQDEYVVSQKGLKSVRPSLLKRQRDIKRMLYLASKTRGGKG